MKGWAFLGDAHLNPYRKGEVWEKFLLFCEDPPEVLVLMGDVFDFWFGFRDTSSLEALYGGLEEAFLALKKARTRLIFLEGNHDFGLNSKLFGLEVVSYRWEAVLDLEGLKVYLAHGDRASGFPHNLPCLFLKNPFSQALIRAFGAKVVLPIGFWWAGRSSRRDRSPEVAFRLRDYALKKLARGFDAVIMGHSHRPECLRFELNGRPVVYLNVGSFSEGYFGVFRAGSFGLEKI